MAGVTLPYKLKSRLAQEIDMERARQTIQLGKHVTIEHVQKRLAEYCSVNVNTIIAIKFGKCRPSILTALKMAEYFDCKVENLFSLEGDETDVKENV